MEKDQITLYKDFTELPFRIALSRHTDLGIPGKWTFRIDTLAFRLANAETKLISLVQPNSTSRGYTDELGEVYFMDIIPNIDTTGWVIWAQPSEWELQSSAEFLEFTAKDLETGNEVQVIGKGLIKLELVKAGLPI